MNKRKQRNRRSKNQKKAGFQTNNLSRTSGKIKQKGRQNEQY